MQCFITLKSSSAFNAGYNWIPWSVHDGLPPRALPVGHEKDGSPIYVGRKRHHDGNVPVKIVPSREFASICAERREMMVQSFDVLVGDGFDWVRSGGGHVPDGAVSCGRSSTNRPIFIGRANHKDSLIPGQVDPRDGRLIIPYEGGTVAYKYYDVLVNRFEAGCRDDGNCDGKWVKALSFGPVPDGAITAGYDSCGAKIYVGRVRHEGNLIPAKIIPEKRMVHTQHEGKEIPKLSYEALCNVNAGWVKFDQTFPSNAVKCGNLTNGETVYIGRGHYWNSLTPGKVLMSTKKLQLPYGWAEVTLDEFEILVDLGDESGSDDDDEDDCSSLFGDPALTPSEYRSDINLCWTAAINNQPTPEGAIVAGYDSDGSTIYVGRVMYEGNQLPAKVIPEKHLCHTQFNGAEIEMSSYEALCFGNVSWVRFRGTIPPNALVCGQTISGENVYIGRGYCLNSLTPGRVFASEKVLYLPHSWKEHRITDFQILVDEDCVTPQAVKWIHTKREQPAPEGALKVGQDRDAADIYLGRVQHDGNRYVGKVIPSKQICDTTHDRKVISKLSYEALCASNVSWVPFAGTFPDDAVECGRTSGGEKVYIGRCNFKSELIPGTVLYEEKKLRIAYDRDEIVCEEFEILVCV